MPPPFCFLISPQRCSKREPYALVWPRNAAGRTVRHFQIGKRRMVWPMTFPGCTVPVSEFRTVSGQETGGGGGVPAT
jgi:hypothetical protein